MYLRKSQDEEMGQNDNRKKSEITTKNVNLRLQFTHKNV